MRDYTKNPDPYRILNTKLTSPSSPPEAIEVNTSPAPFAKANKVTLARILFIFKYSDSFNSEGVSNSSERIAMNQNINTIQSKENSIRYNLFYSN